MKKNWKTALAAMMGQKPTMLFEIDDANGTKLVFPDAADFSEVIEGATVTADDGEYVVTVDGIVTTITVVGGVVTAVTTADANSNTTDAPAEIDQSIVELFQLMGAQLEANDATIAEMKVQFTELKATMSHGGDGDAEPTLKKPLEINGRIIDLKNVNIK